jgi:hypothetical protein
MDLENNRNHLAESANFLAAYEAGDEQALWQAAVYCSGHRIPLYRVGAGREPTTSVPNRQRDGLNHHVAASFNTSAFSIAGCGSVVNKPYEIPPPICVEYH